MDQTLSSSLQVDFFKHWNSIKASEFELASVYINLVYKYSRKQRFLNSYFGTCLVQAEIRLLQIQSTNPYNIFKLKSNKLCKSKI